ncbi:MAG: hypothetical protein JWP38_1352 [Herbaspirillum sp.]|jgi:Ni/Co efflux regulator RcnB|nr:hypothetical protein [Herbaspirillum sp.]
MKIKIIVAAVMAISLSTGIALADDHGHDNGSDQGHGNSHDNGHGKGQQSARGQDRHVADRRDERGAGPQHNFHRGDRLPAEYRSRQYVVSDWRGHHLSAPPRGYHWVQTGGDYVLVSIGSGVVLQFMLGN